MSRIVIDVTGEEHQRIKALAALQGKSMKDYLLEKIFTDHAGTDEDDAMEELENLLAARIDRAEQGAISQKSFGQIAQEVLTERNEL